jgi:hypothetical protein
MFQTSTDRATQARRRSEELEELAKRGKSSLTAVEESLVSRIYMATTEVELEK